MLINTTQNNDTNTGVWTAEVGFLPMHKVLLTVLQEQCQLCEPEEYFLIRTAEGR